jgi:PAS domain S-box-containing protein
MLAEKQSFFMDFGFENLKTLVEKLPLASIVIDAQRRVLYINAACERLYGFRFSEVVQKPVNNMLFLSDPTIIQEAVSTALGGKVVFELEWNEEQYYEGRVFWRQGSIVPLTAGNGEVKYAVITIADVTERVRSHNKVLRSAQDYRMLFESAPDAILIMRETKIIGTNQAAGRVLEYAREELSGKHLWEVSPGLQYQSVPSRDSAEDKISKAMAGAPQCFDWQFLTKTGKIVQTEVNLASMDTHDIPHHVSVSQAIVRKKSPTANN